MALTLRITQKLKRYSQLCQGRLLPFPESGIRADAPSGRPAVPLIPAICFPGPHRRLLASRQYTDRSQITAHPIVGVSPMAKAAGLQLV